jgi:hypothetical protein
LRYVPEQAHVRVHQIWMGDRADNARAASYNADDLMTVGRDIERLTKYTFDMGGTGNLLALSPNVPSWEDLHKLSREELRLTNRHYRHCCSATQPKAAVIELTPIFPRSLRQAILACAPRRDTCPWLRYRGLD